MDKAGDAQKGTPKIAYNDDQHIGQPRSINCAEHRSSRAARGLAVVARTELCAIMPDPVCDAMMGCFGMRALQEFYMRLYFVDRLDREGKRQKAAAPVAELGGRRPGDGFILKRGGHAGRKA